MLLENGGLEQIISGEPDKLLATGATREAVLSNRANIKMSWDLVRLMTDAPIDVNQIYEHRYPKPLGAELKDEEFNDMETEQASSFAPPNTPAEGPSDMPVDYEGSHGRLNAAVDSTKPLTDLAVSLPKVELTKPEAAGIIMPFETSLEPRTVQQAWALAKAIHSSRLFAVESPEAALMILMTGREMNIGAMSAMRGFHFIKGRPVMSAQLMSALILRSGKAEYWELVESDNKHATYATKRIGGRNEQRKTFTLEEARLAQLVKQDGNWAKYPTSMCEARAAAMLARIVYPDLLMGVYLPDELDAEAA